MLLGPALMNGIHAYTAVAREATQMSMRLYHDCSCSLHVICSKAAHALETVVSISIRRFSGSLNLNYIRCI